MGSSPRYEWQEETILYLCRMKLRRFSHFKISRVLSNHLRLAISEAMVSDCWIRLVDCGFFEDKPDFQPLVDRTLYNRRRKLQGSATECPRRASILHLLDLKRAGHSPTRTELKIEADFWPKRLSVQGELRSYCGSTSYMCAIEA